MKGVVGVDVMAMVARTLTADVASADQTQVAAVLSDVAGVRRWLDGVEVACTQRLEHLATTDPSMSPEHVAATATRSSLRRAARVAARAATAAKVSEVGAALAAGQVSGEHVDAVTDGMTGLTEPQRQLLAEHGEQLALEASSSTPDEFRREVAKIVRQIQADDGIARLERQKRAVRLRTWLDRQTGMVRFSGEFDPETGLTLIGRLKNRVETLFHDTTPEHCPDDPLARQDFLRAHAPLDLTLGGGGGAGRVEVSIVIDLQTIVHGRHPETRVDCGVDGLDLPIDTIRRIAMFADIIPVLLDHDGVVLKLGRSRRLASAGQRRALRAMYRTCAVPGCRTPVRDCEPHHCDDWDHGGHTDIERLVPICKHHHDIIHTRHWILTLSPDRSLTITKPDGTTMTTGPPTAMGMSQ